MVLLVSCNLENRFYGHVNMMSILLAGTMMEFGGLFFSGYHGFSNFQDHFSLGLFASWNMPRHATTSTTRHRTRRTSRRRGAKNGRVQLLESLDNNPAGGCLEKPMDIKGYQWIMMLKNCPHCTWHAHRSGAIDVETFVLFGSAWHGELETSPAKFEISWGTILNYPLVN